MSINRAFRLRTAYTCSVALCAILLSTCILSADDGTLIIFRNSAPRLISLWGGGGSEQIVMKSDGTVWDWGYNSFGQVGNGTTNNSCVPAQVLGPGGVGYLAPVAAIMGGEQHNFALKPDGTVWSWGWNNYGQLGDGSTNWGGIGNYSTTPVKVTNLTSIVSLGGRGYHSLALKSDGTVWAWGCNRYGELGVGVIFTGTNVPVQVIGLVNPVCVIGSGFSSFALMPDGTVRAWGKGTDGECGDGAGVDRYTPVQVTGLSNVVAVSGGWFNNLALKSDGTVWAWGSNASGEVGDGTTIQRNVPVQVTTLGTNAVSVWAGDGNSMALLSDGTVWKWGANQYGEQGDGTSDTNSHPLPKQVSGFSNVAFAVCRDYHDICIKWDGTVWVWGDNWGGGCGDSSGNSVLTPRLLAGLVSNNVIPFAQSFESDANGFSMVGTNWWYASSSAMAVVTTNNYTNDYHGTFPVPGSHQRTLQIDGLVTNRFCPSFYSNVWVDVILQVNPWTNPALPGADSLTNAAFALLITTNRHLAVWNCTNAPALGNGWTELSDANIFSSRYVRVTIETAYASDCNGFFYYRVRLNGMPSINPKTWYAVANTAQNWFGDVSFEGHFQVDDLVVGNTDPFDGSQITNRVAGNALPGSTAYPIHKPGPGSQIDWARPLSTGLVTALPLNDGAGAMFYDAVKTQSYQAVTLAGTPTGGLPPTWITPQVTADYPWIGPAIDNNGATAQAIQSSLQWQDVINNVTVLGIRMPRSSIRSIPTPLAESWTPRDRPSSRCISTFRAEEAWFQPPGVTLQEAP